MTKTRMIKIRVTEDADQRIKDAARASGLDASKLIRDAVMRRVQRIEKQNGKEQ